MPIDPSGPSRTGCRGKPKPQSPALEPASCRPSNAPPATPRRPSSEGSVVPSPNSLASAPQELPQLLPEPPFFEELRRQLHPHRHLTQLRPRTHQFPLRPFTPPALQPPLASLQEHSPPLFQIHRRDLKLTAHFSQIFSAKQPQHYSPSSAVHSIAPATPPLHDLRSLPSPCSPETYPLPLSLDPNSCRQSTVQINRGR